eukprot:1737359-Amphidinium_carterae.1
MACVAVWPQKDHQVQELTIPHPRMKLRGNRRESDTTLMYDLVTPTDLLAMFVCDQRPPQD